MRKNNGKRPMETAIQSCLAMLLISLLPGPTSADERDRSSWQTQLLPGQPEFIFTMGSRTGEQQRNREDAGPAGPDRFQRGGSCHPSSPSCYPRRSRMAI